MLKHALLLEWMAVLTDDAAPLQVLDTHAGSGLYDLHDPAARRTGEAERGVGRLMADPAPPPALARLKAAVAAANPAEGSGLRWYPGSPRLALRALRPGDGWIGCELHAGEAQALRTALLRRPGVKVAVRVGDGYSAAGERAQGRRLVLIDAPFERGDEAERIGEALRGVLASPGSVAAVWLPIKDLDGYDRLLSRVEALRPPPSIAVQVRLRPLTDPMRMNGAAMLLIGGSGLAPAAQATAGWVAAQCGEPGAQGRVEPFGG